jgi:hypothetical protein
MMIWSYQIYVSSENFEDSEMHNNYNLQTFSHVPQF